MPIKLLVHDATSGGEAEEHCFERERVTIGRADENILTLPDAKRIVSKRHAEIRGEEDAYQLVDRGSKNFTYLNGKQLRSERPCDLQSGDVFEIGDFDIEFVQVKEEREEPPGFAGSGETVFAADFSNPFDEPVDRLVGALHEIAEAYDEEAPSRRLDALQDAFRQREALAGSQEVFTLVGQCLGLERVAAGPLSKTNGSEERPRQGAGGDENTAREGAEDGTPPGQERVASRRDALVDVLLQAVARLVPLPWQFRHEFIGQTIVQSPGSEALYEEDPEALRAYLTEPSLSEEETEGRYGALREAVDKLVVHQMAMLDGYKAGVQNGAEQLLRDMNPEEKEEDVRKENRFYELVPLFGRAAALEALRETHQDLQDRDWSVAEQRVFRPAFIRAYLARMTASPECASGTEGLTDER